MPFYVVIFFFSSQGYLFGKEREKRKKKSPVLASIFVNGNILFIGG